MAHGAAVTVTAAGIAASSDNTNWVTNGLNTLNGHPSGPEPTMLALLGIGTLAATTRRRNH